MQKSPPAAVSQLQAEFAAFSESLSGELRGPLREFVQNKLQSDPSTAWMASALAPASGPSSETSAARATLTAIKERNDQLHDKSVKKGIVVQFSADKTNVPLADVMKKLEAGESLDLHVIKYEKTSGWTVFGAMALGGSVPYLDGVALNKFEAGKPVAVKNAADLMSAWQDAQLV